MTGFQLNNELFDPTLALLLLSDPFPVPAPCPRVFPGFDIFPALRQPCGLVSKNSNKSARLAWQNCGIGFSYAFATLLYCANRPKGGTIVFVTIIVHGRCRSSRGRKKFSSGRLIFDVAAKQPMRQIIASVACETRHHTAYGEATLHPSKTF